MASGEITPGEALVGVTSRRIRSLLEKVEGVAGREQPQEVAPLPTLAEAVRVPR